MWVTVERAREISGKRRATGGVQRDIIITPGRLVVGFVDSRVTHDARADRVAAFDDDDDDANPRGLARPTTPTSSARRIASSSRDVSERPVLVYTRRFVYNALEDTTGYERVVQDYAKSKARLTLVIVSLCMVSEWMTSSS